VTRPEIAEQLKRAVGLRNVVAHGYTRINVVMLHAAASSGIAELEGFAADIARFVASRRTNVP
jgi:uncharacterized protein YutE (UPF0331/DUF86 family)